MARYKPAWRRVLTARHMRWLASCALVRALPRLGRPMGFFPNGVDLIAMADRVLVDEKTRIPPEAFASDRAFLDQCLPHDSTDPDINLDQGVETGARTGVFNNAWIDMSMGSVLLPGQCATVQMRSAGVNWNTCSVGWQRARVPVEGLAFAPQTTVQYFHMLTENGIRLIDLLERRAIDEPLTVVKPPDCTAVETAMYDGIAQLYPNIAIRRIPGRVMAVPERAVVHFPRGDHWEWPPLDRALARRLADAFAAIYGASAPVHGPNLYLSRQGAKLRRVRNGHALEAALTTRAYDIFEATDTNHAEQIARFAAADTV
ncbi:MAG: glycosyltransferase 61 family protein, partial [Paracoccaceae bacterium]